MPCKNDPQDAWKQAIHVKARLLFLPNAEAGLRKGQQAFTDLVECALEVPKDIYDYLLNHKYFAEYQKGFAARRGRSKRGTNIFIIKKGG